ncbi:MAG: hypothetical protein ACRDLP_02075, partial [Solirubrobacteraceae bacterium]
MRDWIAAKQRHEVVVGSLFVMLTILVSATLAMTVSLLALGHYGYAATAAIVVGLLVIVATTDTALARHQARGGT